MESFAVGAILHFKTYRDGWWEGGNMEQILHWHIEKYGEEKLIVDCHRNETRLIEFAGRLPHLFIYWSIFENSNL